MTHHGNGGTWRIEGEYILYGARCIRHLSVDGRSMESGQILVIFDYEQYEIRP